MTKKEIEQLFSESMTREKFIEVVYMIHQDAYLRGYSNGYRSACDELQNNNYTEE